MRITLFPLAAFAMAACTHAESTPPPAHAAPPPASGGECNAEPAQALVGRQSSPALAAEAQRLSGAQVWRWLRPGEIVTMEFRADRLNLHLDAQGKVERINCG